MARPVFALGDFTIIRPEFEITQDASLQWLAAAHARSGKSMESQRKLLARFGCDASRIATRGHDLPDYAPDTVPVIFDSEAPPEGRGLGIRSVFFEEKAIEYFGRFYPPGASAPPHLFHVTCTGYVSPSAAQVLVARRGWSRECVVTHVYHMGCSAAIPAIRLAGATLHSGRHFGRVDVVHTELCSLHLNPTLHTPEQYVVQSLFADGAIRYSVLPLQSDRQPGLRVKALVERMIPDSLEAMSWRIGDTAFEMGLSAEIPAMIATELEPFLRALFEEAKLSYEVEKRRALFLIHPGGPKILDQVEKQLALRPEQLRHSRKILSLYGNMSSATLPHLWAHVVDDPEVATGTQLVSVAFGPGVTIAGALLEKEAHA